jgi:hypothetical protein
MPFSGMMNDIISVVKPDGRRFDNIKSVVSKDTIVFDDVKVPLEEGDFIERRLPSGMTEIYEVIDRGYFTGMHGIPNHYQTKVRKTTSPPPRYQRAINIHVTGPNARVNLGSTDNSTNVVNSPDTIALFRDLTDIIKTQISSERDRNALLAQAEQMQRAAGSAGYLRAYQDFIQLAANWMTILAPFVPPLTSLLSASS